MGVSFKHWAYLLEISNISVDKRIYLFRQDREFIIIASVFVDITFTSNGNQLLHQLYIKFKMQLRITLFGGNKRLLSRRITQFSSAVKIDQGYSCGNFKELSIREREPEAYTSSIRHWHAPMKLWERWYLRRQYENCVQGDHRKCYVLFNIYILCIVYLVSALPWKIHATAIRNLHISKHLINHLTRKADNGIL